MKPATVEKSETDQAWALLSALDFTPVGHLVLNCEFEVVFWNQCMKIWTSIDRKRIVHTSLFGLFAHFEAPEYRDRIAGVLDGGPPVVFSSQLHKYLIPSHLPNGKLRIHHTTVNRISNPNSNTFPALFSIQDVTSLTDALD